MGQPTIICKKKSLPPLGLLIHSRYASAGMASSGTTITGNTATLVDNDNDEKLTDDDRPTRVGMIH